MKKSLAIAALAALLLCLSGCGGQGETAELFAMDTVMRLTAYGDGAADALADAQREINRLEALLSRTRADSAVSQINASDGRRVAVDPEVAELLSAALAHSAATAAAFDITIAPVASAWGFTEDAYRVPAQEELDGLLAHVGPAAVTLSGGTVTLASGTAIDLGGIAKGYASDRVAEIFAGYGVESGVVSLGGNVYVRGVKPDGSAWKVGIQDPEREGGYLGILELRDAFAITSGGYQRYFEQSGKLYHHILNPATGYPADSGLTSVTVVGNNGAQCDAYSTALFVLGEEKALDLWRRSEGAFGLVLATTDGRVVVTKDLADQFQAEKDGGYDYETVS